jgi:hypothetical protein
VNTPGDDGTILPRPGYTKYKIQKKVGISILRNVSSFHHSTQQQYLPLLLSRFMKMLLKNAAARANNSNLVTFSIIIAVCMFL